LLRELITVHKALCEPIKNVIFHEK